MAHGPHFFVDPADVADSTAVLRGDEAHHLVRVLRARPGDQLSLADGTGAVYEARVADAGGDAVELTLESRHETPAPRPRLTVVHALPKGRKLDDVVQRLSEVGVDRLVPVHSRRSEVRLSGAKADKALGRWRAVALAAGKQSRRARLLEVSPVGEWKSALSEVDAGLVLWEDAGSGLREQVRALADGDPAEVTLAVGPEGGLAEDEAVGGLRVASLGPTVLRTETAALVAATLTLAELGRLD